VTKFGSRRGIASIVGSMIFLILMTSGISVYFLSMQSQSDLIDTQQKVSSAEIRKIQEKYAISVMTDSNDNNRLTVQVKNEGPFSLEIADIWIINKTDAINGYPAARHLLNSTDSFIPIGYGKNILENKPLYMNPAEYDIKVISTIGTIRQTDIDVNGNNDLQVELFAIPPDVRIGENVTIAMRVTNVGDIDIENVIPFGPPIVSPPSAVLASELVSAPSIDVLKQSESGFFTWHYQVTGIVGSKVSFTNNASGTVMSTFTVESNNDSDKITLRVDEGGEGSVVLKDELFGKPDIFMIFPNAMGDNEIDRPLWGVMIVNPTDQIMNVSKVVITAISPRATSSDKIFVDDCHNKSDNTQPVTVAPTTARWTCPESNQLMWRDISNPVIVQPRSVHPFLVRIAADNFGSSMPDAGNVLIQSVVFTTLGQFGKAGYGSTMHSSEVALPNVFLSRTTGSVSSANMLGNITGIVEETSVVFNATLADMGDDDTYGINAGTKLIINIPKDWTFNSISSYTGFNTPITQTFPDGSTQIVGELSSSVDTHAEARSIKFYATAPSVSSAKMYVMYILADGTASGNSPSGVFTVGPIAETVLQVCPTSGCP